MRQTYLSAQDKHHRKDECKSNEQKPVSHTTHTHKQEFYEPTWPLKPHLSGDYAS